MKILWGDESVFKDESVFDPEYLPEVLLHRDRQLDSIAANLRPAVKGRSPMHTVCVGPPATGKTSCVRFVLNELQDFNVKSVYIRCPIYRTEYNIISRIYEISCERLAPQKGVPIPSMLSKISNSLDEPIVVVLDDINFLDVATADSLLYNFCKMHEEFAVKLGLICISTEVRFVGMLETAGAVFHPDEIYFPLYDEGEIRDILRWRVERGFYYGAMSDDAFDRIVELTAKHGDLRFGLYILRMAGISAERRASRKVEVEDVENVYEGGLKVFVAKSISALNSDEREVLKTIYLINEDVSSGDLYAIIYNEVKMSYTRFYEILEKLERLRLIDVVMGSKKKRGRTRYIIKRFERDVILDALKEF